VRAEFSLTTLAYNIKRVMNILGAGKLLEILRKRTQTGKTSSASLFPMHYPPTLAHSRLGSSIARLFTSNTTFPLQSSISK